MTVMYTGLFVKINLGAETFRFSDINTTITIDSETYQGLGQFVGITSTTSELKTTSSDITVTISGIPDNSITSILDSAIKGAEITIQRIIFNDVSMDQTSISSIIGRFFGIVNNYSLEEDYDNESRKSSNTIALMCSSVTQVLENKVSGRKTNPTSFKSFYSSDISMDRVPSLIGANFDFGVPK